MLHKKSEGSTNEWVLSTVEAPGKFHCCTWTIDMSQMMQYCIYLMFLYFVGVVCHVSLTVNELVGSWLGWECNSNQINLHA